MHAINRGENGFPFALAKHICDSFSRIPVIPPMERTEQDVYLRVDDAVKKEDDRTALAVGNCLSF